MISDQHNGITIHRFRIFDATPCILHGVSGREGGASAGPYASLNLGLHVNDDPRLVLENRSRLCRVAGIDALRLTIGEQVHGGVVRVVTAADAGRGAADHATAVAGADALVTAEPGLPLTAFSADCPLVILHDPHAKVLGLVHASWRSSAAGIVAASLHAMARLGAHPPRVLAAIAPCVGKCCYQVRNDFVDIVMQSSIANAERYIEDRNGQTCFDMQSAVIGLLRGGGIAERNIEAAGVCTACSSGRFYSHRASGGRTGRFAAFAQLL